MLGLRLFMHAVRMTANNWQAALQIFALPIAATLLILMGLTTLVGLGPFFLFTGETAEFSGSGPATTFLFFLCLLCIWLTMSIGVVHWHRFILLGEMPRSLMFRLSWMQALKYMIGALAIFLVLILPLILVTLVVSKIAGGFMKQGDLWVAQGFDLVINLGFLTALLALSPILPAAAIDRKFKLGDAVVAMSGSLKALIVCAICLGCVELLAETVINLLVSVSWQLASLSSVVLSAITGLIGISLITTLYGHYIEDRPLS